MIQIPNYKQISPKYGVFARFVITLVVILGFGTLLAVRGGFPASLAFLVGLVCGVILASIALDTTGICPGCKERTGETKLWCCNHCGKRMEKFYGGELE